MYVFDLMSMFQTTYKNYSADTLRRAVDDVKNGMTVYKSAKTHGIPKSTLLRHITGAKKAARKQERMKVRVEREKGKEAKIRKGRDRGKGKTAAMFSARRTPGVAVLVIEPVLHNSSRREDVK